MSLFHRKKGPEEEKAEPVTEKTTPSPEPAYESPVDPSVPEPEYSVNKDMEPEYAEHHDPSEEEVPAGPGSRLRMKKAKLKKGEMVTEPIGPRRDTVIHRSDEEAHRNVKYKIPSIWKQTRTVASVEFKRITRTQVFLYTFLLGLAMIIIVNLDFLRPLLNELLTYGEYMTGSSSRYILTIDGMVLCMVGLLALLPFFGAFYCSFQMAHALPDEFRDRTVFLHFGLPVDKNSYFFGKFMACFMPVLFMIATGYGFAFLSAYSLYGVDMDPLFILKSMAIAVMAAFAISATVYYLSVRWKTGSTIKAFILIVASVPVLLFISSAISTNMASLDFVAEAVANIAAYVPMTGFDVALYNLDSTGLMLSASGMFKTEYFKPGEVSPILAVVIYVVWGAVMLYLGSRAFSRRQL